MIGASVTLNTKSAWLSRRAVTCGTTSARHPLRLAEPMIDRTPALPPYRQ